MARFARRFVRRPTSNVIIEPHELNNHYERGSKYFSSLASVCRQLDEARGEACFDFTPHPLVVDDSKDPVCDYLIVDVFSKHKPPSTNNPSTSALKLGIRCDAEVKLDTVFRDGKEISEVSSWVQSGLQIRNIIESLLPVESPPR